VNPPLKLNDLYIYDFGEKVGLIGAIFGDENASYIMMFPDQELHDNVKTLELNDEDWRTVLRQTDILEVEVLSHTKDGKTAKAVLRKSQRLIEGRVSWSVYKRDQYRCRYCGRDGIPLTVDHLVLWEEGGPSIPENLVTACRKCNKTRGSIQYAEWLRHPYYLKESENIGALVRQDNEDLVATLDAIPRNLHVRSRGKKKK
jgi:hypothetical protein